MYTIWNVDVAKPVRTHLPRAKAFRLASLLERLFDVHYTVIRSR